MTHRTKAERVEELFLIRRDLRRGETYDEEPKWMLEDLLKLFARVEALEAELDQAIGAIADRSAEKAALEAENAALKAQVAEMSEPDFFWERDNPEEGYPQERDLADATGEEAVVMEMSCARTLPCYWMAATYHEINGWNVTRHATKEEAEASCAARTTLTKEPDNG